MHIAVTPQSSIESNPRLVNSSVAALASQISEVARESSASTLTNAASLLRFNISGNTDSHISLSNHPLIKEMSLRIDTSGERPVNVLDLTLTNGNKAEVPLGDAELRKQIRGSMSIMTAKVIIALYPEEIRAVSQILVGQASGGSRGGISSRTSTTLELDDQSQPNISTRTRNVRAEPVHSFAQESVRNGALVLEVSNGKIAPYTRLGGHKIAPDGAISSGAN